MAAGTCFEPKEEQLYMLELLVDRLNLSPEKVQEVRTTPLCVRLKFVDFPTFEISQEEFVSSKKRKERGLAANSDHKNKDGLVDFSAGKSCLFPKQPRDLVQAMQSRPLKVGIYKTSDKPFCATPNENFPVCETQVPLSGCLCDQVAMAMNDSDHLPKPYTLKNTYNLIDLQGRPSGTIAIFLRLSCFGKSIVTHFALQETSFLFKSSSSANEFQCTRVPPDEEELAKRAKKVQDKICRPEGYEEPNLDAPPKPQAVIGLASICQELAMRDGGPPEVIPSPAEQTAPPCRAGIDKTTSENLTGAAKSNDRGYAGPAYRAYPNDPTCVCSQNGNYLKASTGDFPCTGAGCGGGLCIGTRRLDLPPRDYSGGSKGTPCYTGNCCAGSAKNDGISTAEDCCGRPRMRGGGRCGGGGGFKPGNIVSTAQDNINAFSTSNERNFTNHNGKPSSAATQSIDTLISGACKSPLEDGGSNTKPGCCCFGMTGGGEMTVKSAKGTKGGAAYSKEPCSGIDCLLRAFKETQEFVDSIGKVPGLAGLGLMDLSDSPYFGREKDIPGTSCAPRKTAQPPLQLPIAPNQQCPGPCNTQDPKKVFTAGSSIGSIPAALTSPIAASVGGRSGALMRDALSSQPEGISISSIRIKKNQEKADKQKEQETALPPSTEIETGPCGEPKCKSKRKRAQEERIVDGQSTVSLAKKPAPVSKLMSVSSKAGDDEKSEDKAKKRARGKSNSPGPAGDRKSGRSSYIKVSKRIMKLVYSSGIRYSGINYGHKNCVEPRMRVPANMGWLWNTNAVVGKFKPRFGWKPGAISKYLYDLLEEAKAGAGSEESVPASTPIRGKKGKVTKIKSFQSIGRGQRTKKKEGEAEEIELPPTLHIHRKDGTYYVTMYPIKHESIDVPQVEKLMKPLQFKITKNKDDDSVCSSSTASDMEIEFSPPAALNRYHKKPDVTHIDTQVKQQEIFDALKPPSAKQGNAKKGKKEIGKKK